MKHEQELVLMRANLFAAAQILKDEDAREFWKLIDDIQAVRSLYDPNRKGKKDE